MFLQNKSHMWSRIQKEPAHSIPTIVWIFDCCSNRVNCNSLSVIFNNIDFVCKENNQIILANWMEHHMVVTRSTASQTSPRHSVHTNLLEWVYVHLPDNYQPGGHPNLSLSGCVHQRQDEEEGSVNGEYTATVWKLPGNNTPAASAPLALFTSPACIDTWSAGRSSNCISAGYHESAFVFTHLHSSWLYHQVDHSLTSTIFSCSRQMTRWWAWQQRCPWGRRWRWCWRGWPRRPGGL